MVKKRTIYTTSDGKEFDNEKEAKEHDEKVIRESIKVYKVYYNPDLNEGRGYEDDGYVYVHANKHHRSVYRVFPLQEVWESHFLCHGYFWLKCNHADIYLSRSS